MCIMAPHQQPGSPVETPNWQQIIKDINTHGEMSYRAMADELGCSLGAIGDLARGESHDATYTRGVRLLALHKKTMRKAARRKA